MSKNELDRYYQKFHQTSQATSRYAPTNPGHLFMVQQRQRATFHLFRQAEIESLSDLRILEIGCGTGGVLAEYLPHSYYPGSLHGIELLDWRIAIAKERFPHLPLLCADGQQLPYADQSFDLVLQYTVFTSILDEDIKRRLAQEMVRVTAPGGAILWYDFWINPFNRHVKGIRPAEIRALFPDARFTLQRVTLAPPITRLLAPRSWLACYLIEQLRIFNTHYLVLIRPH